MADDGTSDFTDSPTDQFVGSDSVDPGIGGWVDSAAQFTPIALNSLGSSGVNSAQFTPVMGSIGGFAAGAGAAILTLGGRLAGMFGRGAGSAVINGVKFSMSRLWPYVRKYGPTAVAAALGIGVEQLAALLAHAPMTGGTRRRRGISARDIRTTRRVVNFTNHMSKMIGCVHRPHYRSRKG